MKENIEVKQAAECDIELVKHLYDVVIDANTGTEYDVLWRRDLHPSDAAIEAAVRQGEMYVAWLGGELVGAGILNCDFAPGYEGIQWHVDALPAQTRCLHLFCTHPQHQGKGLATAFLEGLLDAMRNQGVKAVRLDVFDYNAPAKHLYEKVGFDLVTTTFLSYEDQEVSHIPFDMYEIAL